MQVFETPGSLVVSTISGHLSNHISCFAGKRINRKYVLCLSSVVVACADEFCGSQGYDSTAAPTQTLRASTQFCVELRRHGRTQGVFQSQFSGPEHLKLLFSARPRGSYASGEPRLYVQIPLFCPSRRKGRILAQDPRMGERLCRTVHVMGVECEYKHRYPKIK